METTNEAASAAPKDNTKTQKNTDIAIIILVVLLILTAIFAIYEHLLRVDAENVRYTADTSNDADEATETPTPTYQPVTPEKVETYANNQQKLTDTVQKMFDDVISNAEIDTSAQINSYDYPLNFTIKPTGTLTSFISPTYSYGHTMYIVSSKEDITKIEAYLLEAFEKNGYEPTDVFYDFDEAANKTGYLNNTIKILCEPIRTFEVNDKYELVVSCVDSSEAELYSEGQLKEINQKAEAYKKSTGKYPDYLSILDYARGFSLYNEKGDSYFILPGLTTTQFDEYFYQNNDSEEWKFAGNDLCHDGREMTSEEKKLFVCVKEDGWSYISLRGNF